MVHARVQDITLNVVAVVVGIPSMLLTIGLLTTQHSTLFQWLVADLASVGAFALSTWLTMVLLVCMESIIRYVWRRPNSRADGEDHRDSATHC